MIKTDQIDNFTLKIVMYHYVTNRIDKIKKNFKYLSIKKFENQIKYLKNNFEILDPIDFHSIINDKNIKLKKSILLTFDDGYIDHYKNVLPILEKNKLKAIFYPVISSITKNVILDVNKIHLILSFYKNHKLLLKLILGDLEKNFNINISKILSRIDTSSKYDSAETIIIKRLLQRDLNENIRSNILNRFIKKLRINENSFSKKLYLNIRMIKEMKKLGHEIGCHTYSHRWLGHINEKNQLDEINKNLNYLKKNKLLNQEWSFCYPYGNYNRSTIKILQKLKCNFAVTTIHGDFNKKFNKLELPRIDTNEIV